MANSITPGVISLLTRGTAPHELVTEDQSGNTDPAKVSEGTEIGPGSAGAQSPAPPLSVIDKLELLQQAASHTTADLIAQLKDGGARDPFDILKAAETTEAKTEPVATDGDAAGDMEQDKDDEKLASEQIADVDGLAGQVSSTAHDGETDNDGSNEPTG